MSSIFVSYTSSDKRWAEWIGQTLGALGHDPHLHDWEISGGGNIYAWMEKTHNDADHVLCVVSKAYLTAAYSNEERYAAQLAGIKKRPNFTLPVVIEDCDLPTMLAPLKRCSLVDIGEDEARTRLKVFLEPAGKPSQPVPFPGTNAVAKVATSAPTKFPGPSLAMSNVPVATPKYFFGRDDALSAIEKALNPCDGRMAIVALHGMRGVGKTTLAAAYCKQCRASCRVIWWIRAQTIATLREDIITLGVRLNWISADLREELALNAVLERLRDEGDDILLTFDSANSVTELKPYLPKVGKARILITSTNYHWHTIAERVKILPLADDVGGSYLAARTGHSGEHSIPAALSKSLGGLPLALEQAAAYCERLSVSLSEYSKRLKATPTQVLDNQRDAPDGVTVAKTFALAIEEAAKLHAAADPMLFYASLLALEPIPVALFSEARQRFGEPLSSLSAGEDFDEAIAALRAFALIDREMVTDEHNPTIEIDCVRLHRLVRQFAATRRDQDASQQARGALIEACTFIFPQDAWQDTEKWPLARRLNAIALELVADESLIPDSAKVDAAALLQELGLYQHHILAAYAQAQKLHERALAIREQFLGREHADTATSLSEIGVTLEAQGEFETAIHFFERALEIRESMLTPNDLLIAQSLNNLASPMQDKGDLAGARLLYERALKIHERVPGQDLETATCLNNLGGLLMEENKLEEAKPLIERALEIRKRKLGPNHSSIAASHNALAKLFQKQSKFKDARTNFGRALDICEKGLGTEHPNTNRVRQNLARLLLTLDQSKEALELITKALSAHEAMLGPKHAWTKESARLKADALDACDEGAAAVSLRTQFGV